MLLNPYFRSNSVTMNENFSFQGENFSNTDEKEIVDAMQEEVCSNFGIRAYYLPKEIRTMDLVFGEAIGSTFLKKFEMSVVPDNALIELGKDVIQSFGYSIETPAIFYAPSYSTIEGLKNLHLDGRNYPAVQDCLYIPLWNQLYQINFINQRINTFQHGSPRIFKFICQTLDIESDTFHLNDLHDVPMSDINEALNKINDYHDIKKEARANEITQCEVNDRLVEGVEYNDQWENLLKTSDLEKILVK